MQNHESLTACQLRHCLYADVDEHFFLQLFSMEGNEDNYEGKSYALRPEEMQPEIVESRGYLAHVRGRMSAKVAPSPSSHHQERVRLQEFSVPISHLKENFKLRMNSGF